MGLRKNILYSVSEKKQKLIDAKNASPFTMGEKVFVPLVLVCYYCSEDKKNEPTSVVIKKVNQKTLVVLNKEYREFEAKINKTDVLGRVVNNIGANPFDDKFDNINLLAFDLESILFNLNVLNQSRNNEFDINGVQLKELNWNPFVFINGEKRYYQRDFCWTLQDKVNLIDSIYNGIDCGKILIRKRSWETLELLESSGEKELAFRDIVDGKQRLDAIRGFILGEYSDKYGNYYSDLSAVSQMKFTNHKLFSYAEMPESTTDEEVLHQFLKMNFTGVPQSQEHIDYVNKLRTKIN